MYNVVREEECCNGTGLVQLFHDTGTGVWDIIVTGTKLRYGQYPVWYKNCILPPFDPAIEFSHVRDLFNNW